MARKLLRGAVVALRAIVAVAVVLLAAYNIYILVRRTVYGDGLPTVFGYGSAVVVSGSMAPELCVNDVVVIRAAAGYGVGDIVTFYDSSAGEYITHRIVYVSADGQFVTKGDANNAEDNFSVPPAAVVGKVVFVARGLGAAVTFFQSPVGLFAVLAAGVILWLLPDLASAFKKTDGSEDEP